MVTLGGAGGALALVVGASRAFDILSDVRVLRPFFVILAGTLACGGGCRRSLLEGG